MAKPTGNDFSLAFHHIMTLGAIGAYVFKDDNPCSYFYDVLTDTEKDESRSA